MSQIIDAWLHTLAELQPQGGKLLQRTIDEAGGLPAAEENVIYTVSHDQYSFASGYATTYANQIADLYRMEAVIAESNAQKVKDEAEMVRKEAEAEFWESVQGWIDQNGALRMKGDPLPSWLARRDIVWNPA